MPTTAGDIYVRSGTQGAFTEVKYVQGGWLTVDSSSTMVNIDVSRLQQGQLVFVESQNKFYKATVVLADYVITFDDSASFSEYQFLTSSISNFDTQVSRSAAAAGFGTGGGASIPAGTVSSSTQTIANLNGTNILSGSILTSSVTNFNTEVSRSAAASGFGASTLPSGVVSSSAQVSYVLISNIPSGIVSSSAQTIANLNGSGILSGSSSVPAGTISSSAQVVAALPAGTVSSSAQILPILTSSVTNFDTEVSRSAATAGFGSSTLPSGVVSSSAQVISNLNSSGILSGSIPTSSVINFDTEVSRSAAASGFGVGGGSVPAGTVSSSTQTIANLVGTNIVSSSAQTIANLNGSGILSGSLSVPAGTISGSQQITDLGFINQSQTSSMSVATASYVSPTFISASAAASGFGSATLPSGIVSSSAQIVAALPAGTISSSAQILPILTSSITNFNTEVSRSAAASGFGSGGGSTDISALNAFTSSIQTQVDNLTAWTSSIDTDINTLYDSTNSLTAATSSYATTGSNNFIGNQDISGSLVVSDYISTDNVLYTNAIEENLTNGGITFVGGGFGFAFNNNIQVTGSIVATSFTGSLEGTSSWAENVLTASYIDPTFISASAAAAGFGSGGGSVPDGTVSSSAQTIAHLQGTGIISASSSVPAGTVSGSQQITDLGFINQSQTSSMLVGTASLAQTTNEVRFLGKGDSQNYYISFTNVSAGVVPYSAPLFTDNASGLAYNPSTNLIQNANLQGNVTGSLLGTASYVSPSTIVSGLIGQNVVVNTITAQQYVVSSSVSFITTSFSSGSTAFGDSLSDTHTFTGSISITGSLNIGGPFSVNNENLNVSSGSIILTNSSSIVVLDSGIISGTFVGNLNYNYITNLPNLISSSAQIAALGAGLLSSSAQIASDISGAFTSLSSSFASRITALEGAGGGSGIFTLTGSFYSTTNNVKITGSLSVGSGSFKSFEVDSNGFVVFGDMTKDLNTAPVGTIAYSGSDFYLIS